MTKTYNSYVFSFNTDATLTAENGGDSSTGSWSVSTVNDNKIFQIAIDSLPDLSNNWQLQEINYEDDGTRLVIKSGEDEIKFKQECN